MFKQPVQVRVIDQPQLVSLGARHLRRRNLSNVFGLISVLLVPCMAFAERDEIAVGLQGGLMFPAFSQTSSTAFTPATWTVGVLGTYGVLDDLSLTASFSFSTFDGEAEEYSHKYEDFEYVGTLKTTARVYHPQAGVRYKMLSGYDLAPYLDVSVGYAWSTYHDSSLIDDQGHEYDFDVDDFGEGTLTVTGGILVDYRLLNMIFLGIGFQFTYAFGDNLLRHQITIPVQVLYYW